MNPGETLGQTEAKPCLFSLGIRVLRLLPQKPASLSLKILFIYFEKKRERESMSTSKA